MCRCSMKTSPLLHKETVSFICDNFIILLELNSFSSFSNAWLPRQRQTSRNTKKHMEKQLEGVWSSTHIIYSEYIHQRKQNLLNIGLIVFLCTVKSLKIQACRNQRETSSSEITGPIYCCSTHTHTHTHTQLLFTITEQTRKKTAAEELLQSVMVKN